MESYTNYRKVILKLYVWGILLILLIVTLTFAGGCTREKQSDKTTVRFVTWKPNQPAVWDEIVQIFEREHPDIRIVREF
ncbi:MAG: hypothetical protein V1764_00860, partial [Nitrospirota bacterium]